jgi:hypothetical protein
MGALGAVGAGVQLAGAVGSTLANIKAAKANAAGLEYEAQNIEANTAFEARQERRRQRILQGEANAITAASGLDPTSGSPLLLELDRVRQGAMEVESIKRAGRVAATTRRYGADLQKGSIPYSILGGVAQGGSILTNYMMRR